MAWWVAFIVDKQQGLVPNETSYRIRYPGWESKWDEWVPIERLRWPVERNIIESIEAKDLVELWCCGANVPGAWLECRVKKTRISNSTGVVKYCLSNVVQSGNLYVERDRLRLVRKDKDRGLGRIRIGIDDVDNSGAGGGSISRRSLSLLSSMGTSISQRFQITVATRSTSCTIM